MDIAQIQNYFYLLFTDYTLRTITIGTALLGAITGILGCFAVLRKQSLLGDAISHAALPGIAITFLIIQTKNTILLLIGALISGLIASSWIHSIIKKTILKTDTALGIVLSSFFGLGIVLLTYIQKLPNANQSGLENYLFGQAATLMEKDLWVMGTVLIVTIILLAIFWKECKITLFDKIHAQTLGINTNLIEFTMSAFIVIAIIIGLQTAGVILMSALLLAPAAGARQWTNKLFYMILISCGIGISSGVIGTAISASKNNLPTGPVIVLVASIIVSISFIFAPNRGLIAKQLEILKNRKAFKENKILHSFLIKENAQQNNYTNNNKKTLQKLIQEGLLLKDKNKLILSDIGRRKALDIQEKLNPFKV